VHGSAGTCEPHQERWCRLDRPRFSEVVGVDPGARKPLIRQAGASRNPVATLSSKAERRFGFRLNRRRYAEVPQSRIYRLEQDLTHGLHILLSDASPKEVFCSEKARELLSSVDLLRPHHNTSPEGGAERCHPLGDACQRRRRPLLLSPYRGLPSRIFRAEEANIELSRSSLGRRGLLDVTQRAGLSLPLDLKRTGVFGDGGDDDQGLCAEPKKCQPSGVGDGGVAPLPRGASLCAPRPVEGRRSDRTFTFRQALTLVLASWARGLRCSGGGLCAYTHVVDATGVSRIRSLQT